MPQLMDCILLTAQEGCCKKSGTPILHLFISPIEGIYMFLRLGRVFSDCVQNPDIGSLFLLD